MSRTRKADDATLPRLPRRLALRQAAAGDAEIPDKTPIEVPTMHRPLTLREEMQRFVRQELSQQMQNRGMESFEEADDFEIDDFEDEPDMTTGYTVHELFDEDGAPRDELEGEPIPEDLEAAEEAPPSPPVDPAIADQSGDAETVSTGQA